MTVARAAIGKGSSIRSCASRVSSGASSNESDHVFSSHSTAPTEYDEQDLYTVKEHTKPSEEQSNTIRHDGCQTLPRSSSDTYASTAISCDGASSDDDHITQLQHSPFRSRLPPTPSTPYDFAHLFPSALRLRVAHDDTTFDSNMNLTVTTNVQLPGQRRSRTMILYHLRLYDVEQMSFSLRRYHRDSGREICRAQPDKALQRHSTSFVTSLRRGWSLSRKTTPPMETSATSLSFSNYSRVAIQYQTGHPTLLTLDFEYWGVRYQWTKITPPRHVATRWELRPRPFKPSTPPLAVIDCEPLTDAETYFLRLRGGWVPPCEFRLLKRVDDDVADVIIATALSALVRDAALAEGARLPANS